MNIVVVNHEFRGGRGIPPPLARPAGQPEAAGPAAGVAVDHLVVGPPSGGGSDVIVLPPTGKGGNGDVDMDSPDW